MARRRTDRHGTNVLAAPSTGQSACSRRGALTLYLRVGPGHQQLPAIQNSSTYLLVAQKTGY